MRVQIIFFYKDFNFNFINPWFLIMYKNKDKLHSVFNVYTGQEIKWKKYPHKMKKQFVYVSTVKVKSNM